MQYSRVLATREDQDKASPKYMNNDKIAKKPYTYRLFSILGILSICSLLLISLLKPFNGADAPQCESIYMFPSYARIDGFDERYTPLAHKYHLYLYREQSVDREPLNGDELQLDGTLYFLYPEMQVLLGNADRLLPLAPIYILIPIPGRLCVTKMCEIWTSLRQISMKISLRFMVKQCLIKLNT